MAVVFDRDISVNDGLSVNGVIRGLRIMKIKGPYPLLKFEVEAFEGRLNNRFQAFVWHPGNGWLEVLTFVEKDFPFVVTDSSLDACYAHMSKVMQNIFSPNPVNRDDEEREL